MPRIHLTPPERQKLLAHFRRSSERVWWRLHEAVTRNHRCHTMDGLLDLTFDWFSTPLTSE
jgi:hypothetical protein